MSSSNGASSSRLYPSGATSIQDLTTFQRKLKLARHCPCQAYFHGTTRLKDEEEEEEGEEKKFKDQEYEDGLRTPEPEDEHGNGFMNGQSNGNGAGRGGCVCSGFKPPASIKVKAYNVQEAEYDEDDEEGHWGWERCFCGHSIEDHLRLEEDGDDEALRKFRVALRMDELLEDQKKLLDFEYEDEDLASLKKQLQPSGPSDSTPIPRRNRIDSRKRKSRSIEGDARLSSIDGSAAASRESSVQIDGPRTSGAKRRRMQSRSATSSRYHSPATQTADGEGQGHGKMPSQSQKGLPPGGDGAAPTQASSGVDEVPVEKVEQDDMKLDKVVQGVSVDVGQEGDSKPDQRSSEAGTAPPRTVPPAVIEERSALIQFRVVSNDGSPESMIILTGLKNIFQRQLPKMPREYITRLVLDHNHMSMAIVKRGLQVVGGVTYRPFNHRKFAEIVFFAITSTEQVKGYGSHLMNHLKDHVKGNSDVMHFLTYADNYAIGYFKKQGFTKEISLDRSIWVGYIKDYEGGTLMQCSMVPRVEYLKVQDLLAEQRNAVVSKIRMISRSHIVHPGLEVFKNPEGRHRPKPEDPDDPTADFKVDPSEVPGLKESAWTIEMDELSRRPKRGPHHNLMRHILVELGNHQAAWPFTNPVNAQDVPDYYEVIKEPMDLSTMESKLENNQYSNIENLLRDAHLIFDNCRTYNPPTSVYAKSANRLERFVKDTLPQWKQQAGIV